MQEFNLLMKIPLTASVVFLVAFSSSLYKQTLLVCSLDV